MVLGKDESGKTNVTDEEELLLEETQEKKLARIPFKIEGNGKELKGWTIKVGIFCGLLGTLMASNPENILIRCYRNNLSQFQDFSPSTLQRALQLSKFAVFASNLCVIFMPKRFETRYLITWGAALQVVGLFATANLMNPWSLFASNYLTYFGNSVLMGCFLVMAWRLGLKLSLTIPAIIVPVIFESIFLAFIDALVEKTSRYTFTWVMNVLGLIVLVLMGIFLLITRIKDVRICLRRRD